MADGSHVLPEGSLLQITLSYPPHSHDHQKKFYRSGIWCCVRNRLVFLCFHVGSHLDPSEIHCFLPHQFRRSDLPPFTSVAPDLPRSHQNLPRLLVPLNLVLSLPVSLARGHGLLPYSKVLLSHTNMVSLVLGGMVLVQLSKSCSLPNLLPNSSSTHQMHTLS